ncbi:cyclopropane-fatty-acyl-phospholipid synthase family protein [Vogesella sp. LIG4]|uniref:SAM-dependent methyltransferase n=1 Tax=Vogesella sp. LIG4 TaxID=1192162 RepID=UPI00081FE3F4|nr:cyclopropane-fatty-acyl-phospholipid synthase family protein [Vogesella sp. LIG4]SCK16910.1 cyclopropane-fatty-acyl-phospholipid synthase [Vogesella sp. LIG4]
MNTAYESMQRRNAPTTGAQAAPEAGQPPRVPWLARPLLAGLERLLYGELVLQTPDGHRHLYSGRHPGIRAELQLHDWRVLRRIALAGDIGLAEAWRAGKLASPDWPALMKLALENEAAFEQAIHGSWLGTIGYVLRHLSRANTRKGSRRNIHAHYDLGNNFYRLWLDPSMSYSSGLYQGAAELSLQQAQQAKYERILQRLAPRPGQRILEIGCGWGGFAEHAIRHCGVHITGLTLSNEQLGWAQRRLAAAGLGRHAELRRQDYREVSGQYDHIVSIEMLEAVGERWWPSYFAKLRDCLKPGGKALVQVITIGDEHFERYRSSTDFIQQYIFPGGMLPSPTRLEQEIRRAGLHLADRHSFGADYARTLREWLARFQRALPEIRRQGFDDSFIRLWQFYLYYCIAGFEAGRTDVCQLEIRRRV